MRMLALGGRQGQEVAGLGRDQRHAAGEDFHALLICSLNSTRRNISTEQMAMVARMAGLVLMHFEVDADDGQFQTRVPGRRQPSTSKALNSA